ncbi:hemerythrin domain-containing protein [Pararhizobium gei]|uniref:hemerythrin domain-containing protein n=1 Tax=Pararhizobium gei TaxID=1395951 RepID=UPI0023DC36FE|nr:hemerythrin domain-containing protein [Rhizobium gei]
MPDSHRASAVYPGCCEIECLSQEELGRHGVIEAMRLIHDKKVAICRELEDIADGLPAAVDALRCLSVAAKLLPVLRRAHDYEEKLIFPVYEKLASPGRNLSTDRLRAEHMSDECFAADLTGILLKIGHGGPVDQAETFGFMLRGFFDGLRRHVAFEDEHIVPAIRNTLNNRNVV